MSKVITVNEGQCLADIAIQYCGNIEAQKTVADLNDIEVTADILPGSNLLVPDPIDASLVKYFDDNKIIPATLIRNDDYPEGLEIWAIEQDFQIR